MTVKGRHWVLAWLGLFLAVSVAVVGRQTVAYQAAARLRSLREERRALEAREADLQRAIREATGRQVLVPRAERELGLHLPTDSEFVIFPLPAGSGDPER
jgi:cell division protein FtsB